MSGLLYGVGAVAVLAGAVMIGFGIPVNEFSFGNTLIIAGTTAVVGGLIITALAAAVAQLQRIAETMAARTPLRAGRPLDMFEPAAAPRAMAPGGRPPFPTRPKADNRLREPPPPPAVPPVSDLPLDEMPAPASFAPMLRNPETPTVDDEASLSPQHPAMPAAEPSAFGDRIPPAPEPETPASLEPEPPFDAGWRLPPPEPPRRRETEPNYFDAMWPADEKPARTWPAAEVTPEPAIEPPAPEGETPAPHVAAEDEAPAEPLERAEPAAAEPEARTVAILKSGVVDGMGYTLYVDGSIEAELPQGTLRFASINELRSHLEQNS